MIVVKNSNTGKVSIEYTKTHNHEIKPQHIKYHPIPLSEREKLKTKLAVGISVDKVFRDLREGLDERQNGEAEFHPKKTLFIPKRTIKEMAKTIENLSKHRHPDDAQSVYLMVQALQAEDYSGVLMYKPQDGKAVAGPDNLPTDKELFVLGHMTKQQEDRLKENAFKIVCVDSTHEITMYKFKLVTLLVPDEFRRGYPVAYLITSCEDTTVLTAWFTAIKKRVGDITINALMTDDDNAGWNAFSHVFGDVSHFLCVWHLHRAWARKVRELYRGNEEAEELYQALVVLMQEKNLNKFGEHVVAYKIAFTEKYPEYLKYLESNYFNRFPKWALCFRNFPHAGTDTNMFVESFHNKLKTNYMKRQKNRRVDDLLEMLLAVEKDDYWRHKSDVFFEQGVGTGDDDRHKRGMTIPHTDVKEECDRWMVTSQTAPSTLYSVKRVMDVCVFDHCVSKCAEVACAGLCGHLYTCSCKDKSDICKHIHKVHAMVVRTNLQAKHRVPNPVPVGETVNFTEPTTVTPLQRVDKVENIRNQLETLQILVEEPAVKSLLLSHVKGTLDKLIRQCQAVVSSSQPEMSAMEVTEKMAPNQKLSHISKMKRKKKKEKKKKKMEEKKFDWKHMKENLTINKDEHEHDTAPTNENPVEEIIYESTSEEFESEEESVPCSESQQPSSFLQSVSTSFVQSVPVTSQSVSCSSVPLVRPAVSCSLLQPVSSSFVQSVPVTSKSVPGTSRSVVDFDDDAHIALLMSLNEDVATSPPAITIAQPKCNLCKRPKSDKIYRNLKWNVDALEGDEGEQFDWVTCPKCSRSYHRGCLWGSIGEADATCFHCD